MKTINLHIILIVTIGFVACVEDVNDQDPVFKKLVGKEGISTGQKILELDNGEFIIVGNVGVSAFDITNTINSVSFDQSQNMGSTIMRLDPNGNLINMRSFPIEDFEIGPILDTWELGDKATFIDVLQNNDGSFYVLGQLRGFSLRISTNTIDTTLHSTPERQLSAPFLIKLSESFDMEFIRLFNGGNSWDGVFHLGGKMKKLRNNDIGIIFMDFLFGSSQPSGYSFLQLNTVGDTIKHIRQLRFSGVKLAQDFIENETGGLTILGQRHHEMVIFNFESGDLTNEQSIPFDLSRNGGNANTNESYFFQSNSNEPFVVYTNPPQSVLMSKLDDNFQIVGAEATIINHSTENEYARAATQCKNGDFLIYTEHLHSSKVQGIESIGYLYRISPDFEVLFRKEFLGLPGDVIEANDGSIMVLSNPIYNDLLPKMQLTKLNANGELY